MSLGISSENIITNEATSLVWPCLTKHANMYIGILKEKRETKQETVEYRNQM